MGKAGRGSNKDREGQTALKGRQGGRVGALARSRGSWSGMAKKIVQQYIAALFYFDVPKKSAKEKIYGTSDSHVVPHHSTDEALSSLTLQIGRDAVLFAWYGRR